MLPFSDPQNNLDKLFHDQLELPVPDSSYFSFTPATIFCLDGALHDLLLLPSNSSSDVTGSAAPAVEAQQNLADPTDSAPLFMAAAGMDDRSCGRRVRSTRKDRHSKIFTASGPRDRRMRLSIDVARRFFQLQDMLGFDKASKTVQWLLTMSKAAIKDLATASRSNQSPKSTESSTLSGSKNKTKSKSKSSTVTADADRERKTKAKRGATKPSRKTKPIHSALARESRAKARERARERTKEKRRNITNSLSSSVPMDATIKEESSLQNIKSIYHDFLDDKERKSCLNMAGVSSSERTCEYLTIAGSGSLQVPAFGNNNQEGLVAAAAAAAISVDAPGCIFQEEYWADMDSFYSR